MISWQEIVIRLLFAFILGSAVAVGKKWYQTKQLIQATTLMAMGAGIFSLLIGLTSETKFSSDLIIAISILCLGMSFLKPTYVQSMSIDAVTRLWFAGAVGSMVGSGFFVPAYIGILFVVLTNLLFPAPEKRFTPDIESELNNDSKPETEPEQTATTIFQPDYYRCQIECLAADEAEVLALLIQLSKEQELTPTKISSRNLVNNNSSSELEIQVDFIAERNISTLQLQQVVMGLKSKLEIISASWVHLSPESIHENNQAVSKSD